MGQLWANYRPKLKKFLFFVFKFISWVMGGKIKITLKKSTKNYIERLKSVGIPYTFYFYFLECLKCICCKGFLLLL